MIDAMVCGKGRYTLVKDVDEVENGVYDKPLPCFGCGIGWFSWVESIKFFLSWSQRSFSIFSLDLQAIFLFCSFLLGFVFPFLWYYATFLYFGNYYRKDPRERAGLAASAITVITLFLYLILLYTFLERMMKNWKSGDVAGDGILPLATSDCCFLVALMGSLTYTP